MNGAYMQTPLFYRGILYNGTDRGDITCYKPEDGQVLSQMTLTPSSSFSASAVAGDGKIYYAGEKGTIYVLEAGSLPKLLATNEMGEPCLATPALSGGWLIVRTSLSVIAIKGD